MKNKSVILYIALFYFVAVMLRYFIVIVKPDFYTHAPHLLQGLLTGIGPFIGALLLIIGFRRKNDLQFFSIGILPSLALILLPIFLFLVAAFIESGEIQSSFFLAICAALLYGFLEEYGWRGYLQSELRGMNKFIKYFIVSILWYIWHLDFGLDIPHLVSYFYILAGSIGIGFVADKSKSIVLPSLFHAFFNILFDSSSEGVSITAKMIIISICILSIVLVMIKTKKQQPADRSSSEELR